MCEFTLFITQKNVTSKKLVETVNTFLTESFSDRFRLNIVEVLRDPESALQNSVMATPTLLKTVPAPSRQVTGNLWDKEQVLAGLGLAA